MATFSTNQVRQLYVVNSYSSGAVTQASKVGAIGVKTDADKSHLYFEYRGADNLMRSDLIKIDNIISATPTKHTELDDPIQHHLIKLDPNINGGNPIPGQDYILRIAFRQYVGMSDEDQYFKYGMVHAYAGMSKHDFYIKLMESLFDNLSREVTPLISITVIDNSGAPLWTYTNKLELREHLKQMAEEASELTFIAIVINSVLQPYRRGIMSNTPVDFTCQPTTINVDGDEVVWGVVTKGPISGDKNSFPKSATYKIADLEYFCMGERGDIYRGVEFPHNIPTTYLVDLNKEYDLIDIHYHYSGSNESVQKSEKTITLAVEYKSGHEEMNKIINAINTATGLNIKTLA